MAHEIIETYGEHPSEFITPKQLEEDIKRVRTIYRLYDQNNNMIAKKRLAMDLARSYASNIYVAGNSEFTSEDVDSLASLIRGKYQRKCVK